MLAQVSEHREPSQSHIRPGVDVTYETKYPLDNSLVKFFRGNKTYKVEKSSGPQEACRISQGVLGEILGDEGWDRPMVEDFYQEIDPNVRELQSSLTPYLFVP